jgi:hypothetical protein
MHLVEFGQVGAGRRLSKDDKEQAPDCVRDG